ncbi:hypothetical protein INR77_11935 [Erythrobacter sp. SCSIO 43205]|uniref:hypothetical protein n=1 Tax=Erythrobacter sp. SCSIO 43205 TaxID=2779361 RepID=UPI001CA8B078|nr:hypothetical protein [Erythrobacter sp. SCSIO 43205]UAB77504.1 hypothetical protein INR77_11935 [Erythrobacter sp. SCSIO 43205]
MDQEHDPLWQAPADHINALGIAPDKVIAPSAYRAVLPGCGTRCVGPGLDELEAVILHKGLLGEMPGKAIVKALDEFAPTFANEVFLVFSKSGEALEEGHPHVPSRDWLLSTALGEQGSMYHIERTQRMAPTYVGHERVLVETA